MERCVQQIFSKSDDLAVFGFKGKGEEVKTCWWQFRIFAHAGQLLVTRRHFISKIHNKGTSRIQGLSRFPLAGAEIFHRQEGRRREANFPNLDATEQSKILNPAFFARQVSLQRDPTLGKEDDYFGETPQHRNVEFGETKNELKMQKYTVFFGQ